MFTLLIIIKYALLKIFTFLLSVNQISFSQSYIASENCNSVCINHIEISGKTKISSFSLKQSNRINMVRSCHIDESSSLIQINIPTIEFASANHLIIKDFLKLIKSEYLFPKIWVTIAGVKNYSLLQANIKNFDNSGILLKGEKKINFADFEIEPPTKSFGLIRVQNEVIITFEIFIPYYFINRSFT